MGLSQVGYITEMHGEKFNITVTNAPAHYLQTNNNIALKSCSLIISSPTNENWYDIGTPSLLVTDKNSNILRLTYAVKSGDGLLIDNDSIRLGIDKETIKTNKYSLLYVSAADLIADSGKSLLAKKIGDDIHDNRTYLVVNSAGFTDNLSLQTFNKTEKFIPTYDLNPDLLTVNNKFLVDNISLKTSIIEDKALLKTIWGDNSGNIHPADRNNKLYLSYCTKLSVNVDSIIDNNTLKILDKEISSKYTSAYNHYDNNKQLTTTQKVIKVETENLEKASNEKYGVVKVSNNIISSNGSISVNTQALSKANNTNYGVVKVDGNTIISNDGLISVGYTDLCYLMKSCYNGLNNPGTVIGDNTYITTSNGIVTLTSSFTYLIKSLQNRITELENQTDKHYFTILGNSNFSDVELAGKELTFYIDDQSESIDINVNAVEWTVDNTNVTITNKYIENNKHYCKITIANDVDSSFNFTLTVKAAAASKYEETTRSITVYVNKTEPQNKISEYNITSIQLQQFDANGNINAPITGTDGIFSFGNNVAGNKYKVIINVIDSFGNDISSNIKYSISSGDVSKVTIENKAIVFPNPLQTTNDTLITINISGDTIDGIQYQSTIEEIYINIDAIIQPTINLIDSGRPECVLHYDETINNGTHIVNYSYIYFGEESNNAYIGPGFFTIPFVCENMPDNPQLEVTCNYSNYSKDNGKLTFEYYKWTSDGKLYGNITCNYTAPLKGYITIGLKFNGIGNYSAASNNFKHKIYTKPGIPKIECLTETTNIEGADRVLINSTNDANETDINFKIKPDIISTTLLSTSNYGSTSYYKYIFNSISIDNINANGSTIESSDIESYCEVKIKSRSLDTGIITITLNNKQNLQLSGRILFNFANTYTGRSSTGGAQITSEKTEHLWFTTKQNTDEYGYTYDYNQNEPTGPITIDVKTEKISFRSPQGNIASGNPGLITMRIYFGVLYTFETIQSINGNISESSILDLFNFNCTSDVSIQKGDPYVVTHDYDEDKGGYIEVALKVEWKLSEGNLYYSLELKKSPTQLGDVTFTQKDTPKKYKNGFEDTESTTPTTPSNPPSSPSNVSTPPSSPDGDTTTPSSGSTTTIASTQGSTPGSTSSQSQGSTSNPT